MHILLPTCLCELCGRLAKMPAPLFERVRGNASDIALLDSADIISNYHPSILSILLMVGWPRVLGYVPTD